MTQAEFFKEMKAVVNIAYLRFSTKQTPPFAVYALPSNDDFPADNCHYYPVQNGWLELYMSKIDFELMKRVEEVFIKNKIPWEKENEAYISDENIFYARWSFQLF